MTRRIECGISMATTPAGSYTVPKSNPNYTKAGQRRPLEAAILLYWHKVCLHAPRWQIGRGPKDFSAFLLSRGVLFAAKPTPPRKPTRSQVLGAYSQSPTPRAQLSTTRREVQQVLTETATVPSPKI